jgi:inorganic phosphate transporter, PiT family
MIAYSTLLLLGLVIFCSLGFILSNGLHDASSVIATLISSGAASSRVAILLAAGAGLAGAMTGGHAVADTIASLIDLPEDKALLPVLLAAILGALAWNLATWKLGLPSSSTHALVGGIIGAVSVAAGPGHILWGWQALVDGASPRLAGILLVVAGLFISPLFGFIVAFALGKISRLMFRNASFGLNRWLNRLQYLAAAVLAYSHGANDTQKSIGILTTALLASGLLARATPPLWVQLASGLLMFGGTLLGGWPIMKTIGRGLYDIQPIHSVNSQMAAVSSILFATLAGAPISTTHVVVGSVMGVGTADRYKMVRWQVIREILMAWLITMPAAAAVAGVIMLVVGRVFP